MTRPLVVLNVVGLTHSLLGPDTPHLSALAAEGFSRPLGTVLPAVTCSAQSTLLTGTLPREHGIVGNGWYFRDLAEVGFWKQSNHLVQGETIADAARLRDSTFTCAKLFWWYNMYARVDYSMTPRPSYPADGRKIFDSYSFPGTLRDELQAELGVFPLPAFWGPLAGIASSQWITSAAIRVLERHSPKLTLVYLPHLDYSFQRLGPDHPDVSTEVRAIDVQAGRLIAAARSRGAEVLVVSEYAITPVSQPVHLNRVLREAGYLQVRREPLGWETLDAGASRAFAVADHQVAHVYVATPADLPGVIRVLEQTPGVERVLDRAAQREYGIDHDRAGELVVIASREAWFTYYFWLDDALAPDYARTIDIHRKPGYDPAELFVDPKLRWPQVRIARRLAQKMLGFRYYMDVIGLDASIVKGSHGRLPDPGSEETDGPVVICSDRSLARDQFAMTDIKELALRVMRLA